MMENFRNALPESFDGIAVAAVRDYQASTRTVLKDGTTESIQLPKSNVIYVELADGSYFVVRPSGTEPKIKLYFAAKEKNAAAAETKINGLRKAVLDFVG